jgi:hypothetical protein
MKAPIAQAGGRWGGRLPTGLCFYFFMGPRNRKMYFKTRISAGFRFSHAEYAYKKISSSYGAGGPSLCSAALAWRTSSARVLAARLGGSPLCPLRPLLGLLCSLLLLLLPLLLPPPRARPPCTTRPRAPPPPPPRPPGAALAAAAPLVAAAAVSLGSARLPKVNPAAGGGACAEAASEPWVDCCSVNLKSCAR